MNPYDDEKMVRVQQEFCAMFYKGAKKRLGIFGINPGRLGAGITGIPFTDPKTLKEKCHIHSLDQTGGELSSEFIYTVIERLGGLPTFYRQFYLGSVCPLGLLSEKRNANYYDNTQLATLLRPWIAECMKAQIQMGLRTDAAVVLGTGKNARYFNSLNDQFSWFKEIHVLDHPRYIMQYKRKHVTGYQKIYRDLLTRLQDI